MKRLRNNRLSIAQFFEKFMTWEEFIAIDGPMPSIEKDMASNITLAAITFHVIFVGLTAVILVYTPYLLVKTAIDAYKRKFAQNEDMSWQPEKDTKSSST